MIDDVGPKPNSTMAGTGKGARRPADAESGFARCLRQGGARPDIEACCLCYNPVARGDVWRRDAVYYFNRPDRDHVWF